MDPQQRTPLGPGQGTPPQRPVPKPTGLLAVAPRRLIMAFVVVVALLALITVIRMVNDARQVLASAEGRTTLTQDIVVEGVRAVAKLVSSEMTVRDVVTYRNTRYGSTKQALIVVTGKILAGIDLEQGSEVRIDSVQRRITIRIPEAKILAVDVVQLRTYDEQRGLWNPFQPSDRDAIFGEVRRQLQRSAADMGIVARANESAARMLVTMFSVDGYTAEVIFGAVTPAAPLDGPRTP